MKHIPRPISFDAVHARNPLLLGLLVLLPRIGIAQGSATLVVQQNANLRTGPSASRPIIRTLQVGDTIVLLSAHTRSDYLHVAASADTGWVFSALVELTTSAAPAPPVVVRPDSTTPITTTAGLSTAPSAYHGCALGGNPSPNGPNVAALTALNNKKNRWHAPASSDIDPSFTLVHLLQPGADDARFNDARAGEIEGFVVDVKVGGVETVNCKATDPLYRDTHIEVADHMGAPTTQRVIVEVTPRWRAAMQAAGVDWTTPSLHALIGKRVRFRGWAMFDQEHRSQAENTAPGNPSNWRATVWELHPVTSFTVLGP
jgi:uncharacterized protein YraI